MKLVLNFSKKRNLSREHLLHKPNHLVCSFSMPILRITISKHKSDNWKEYLMNKMHKDIVKNKYFLQG